MTPITRRSLLTGAAGIGASSLIGSAIDSATAATLQGSLPKQVDVVVVGGGLSGRVAARQVARAGRRVLVVEARRRVGGRLLNHRLREGSVIEAGGAFVGPTQDHILELARELKVPTFDEYVDGENVYISALLGRQTYTGTVPPDPTILVDALLLTTKLDAYAKQLPVDAPWAHPRAAEWDAITLETFVKRNTVNSAGMLKLLESWTHPSFGAQPNQVSLLFVIAFIARSGNERTVGTFARNSDTKNGAQEQRFVGGSQLIPIRLASQLGNIVALAAAAHRIDQRSDHAVVHTSRGAVRCKRVIVATPPPLSLDIDWYPRLPSGHQTLLSEMNMGKLMKCDAVYDKPFWRDAGLSGSGVSHNGAARTVFDNSPPDGRVGVLLAFVGGAGWQQYGSMSVDERRRNVLEGFARMFGPKALKPIEYTEHDWTKEQWTGGGPTAITAPGTMTRYGQWIRRPFGRVHWAGTETSTYWAGFMDGAVRAGERAAIEVVEKL
jgi:monoamine oxidase